ncbi:MAG: conjugal transfer protein TraX [Lachnospiraceae bacterium]|nr:conjugal transfer protein TraX [Lachnospiraceae bacterium]
MILDHIAYYFVDRGNLLEAMPEATWIFPLYYVFHIIGRLAFPIMVFLLVEGFIHTKNIKRYVLLILITAFVTEVIYDYGNAGKFDAAQQNPLFILFVGLVLLCGIEAMYKVDKWDGVFKSVKYVIYYTAGAIVTYLFFWEGRSVFYILSGFAGKTATDYLVFLSSGLFKAIILGSGFVSLAFFIYLFKKRTEEEKCRFAYSMALVISAMLLVSRFILKIDYGAFGLLAIVMAYSFRKDPRTRMLAAVLPLFLTNPYEVVSFVLVFIVAGYNGERGNIRSKYFYYVFFPLHIAVIYSLSKLLCG